MSRRTVQRWDVRVGLFDLLAGEVVLGGGPGLGRGRG